MEGSSKELTTPKSNMYVLGEHDIREEKSLDVLNEQTEVPLLEQDLLPPTKDGIDFDLDAHEASALGNIKRSNIVTSAVSRGASVEPSRRRRVHMFEYAVKSPGNKESVSKEPKFKSVDDAVLSVLNGKSLSREELMANVQTLVEQGGIAQDDGDSPITDTAIGVALINLMNNNLLVSDGEGKLKVYKIAGGSTHGSENGQTEEALSTKPTLVEKMNRIVDKVTDKALEGTAYGRLVTKLQSVIDSAPDKVKVRLQELSQKITDSKGIENILSNLATIEGWVPDSEYVNLVHVAEDVVTEEKKDDHVAPTVVPASRTPMFPKQTPRKVSQSVQIRPSIFNTEHLSTEELNRRAEVARNAGVEKLAAEKTDEEKTTLIESAQNFDELYEALRLCKGIRGSQGRIYSAEELVSKIEEARKAVYVLSFNTLNNDITRAHELRDKVKELWTIEHTRKTAQAAESKEQQFDPKELIARAENIDQFCEAIVTIGQTVGDIKDGEKVFTAEHIVDIIKTGEKFNALDLPLTYGIRARYRDLLQVEKNNPVSVEEKEVEVQPPPVYVPGTQPTVDLYDEPIGPVRKVDLSPEESKRIEGELRLQLDNARKNFVVYESAYKQKIREGKKVYRRILEDLGAPEKQRPLLEKDPDHVEASKAYMEAQWNLKNFIVGRDIKEVPFSYTNSLLGQDVLGNKKIDVGVANQAWEEWNQLQEEIRNATPEKEKSIIARGFEKWNSFSPEARIALTSTMLMVGGIAFTTVTVSGALTAAALRTGRAIAGTTLGLKGGKKYGAQKQKEVEGERNVQLDEYGSDDTRKDKEKFMQNTQALTEYAAAEQKKMKRNQLKTAAVTAAIAGTTTVGVDMLARGLTSLVPEVPSGAKVSGNIDSAPKPKVVADANTVSTKSWFDKIFSDNEKVSVKPSALEASDAPQKIDVPFELKGYEPVGVKLSSDGFIDTVSKLKAGLQGHSVSPAVEKLLAQSPEKIAMDLGLYKPGQVAESAFGLQGEELTMNINGDIALMHNDGSVNILFDAEGKAYPFGEYTGNTMFNADHADTSPLPKDVPSVEAPVVVETAVKSVPSTPEVGISAASPFASVAMDSGTVGLSVTESEIPSKFKTELVFESENGPVRALVVNDIEVATPLPGFKSVKDIILGKMPLKAEYQVGGDGKIRTEYNRFFTRTLALMTDEERAQLFDYHLPVQYKGGRIDIVDKDGITVLLNGQRIGSAKLIDGAFGYQYEMGSEKSILSMTGKNDYELAFDEAKKVIEKNAKFFKVKK